MVDSAVSPVDGPTKLEQRKAADQDDRYTDLVTERQAKNVRAYHQSEINRLQRAIEEHQAIVDAQDKILSDPNVKSADEPLDHGTDISEHFDTDAHAPDADPNANTDDPDNVTDALNTPVTPVADSEPGKKKKGR